MKHSKGLLALEPFGQGNEVPLMACLGLSIQDIWVMGKSGEHLKLRLSQGGVAKEFIWFGMGSVARLRAPGPGGCGVCPLSQRVPGRGTVLIAHERSEAFVGRVG